MVGIPIEALITELHTLGVIFWVEDEQLRSKAPKGAITPALRRQIKARKEELVAFLRKAQAAKAQTQTIFPASRSGKIPLSFGQQRLWFMDQLGRGMAYNVPMALNISGPLNVAALQESLQEVVRRHESLRTTFAVDEDTPIQVIHPEMTIDLPVVDLSTYSPEQQTLEVKRLSTAEATRPFDLSRDPMLRATLLRLSHSVSNRIDRQYLLLLTLHHIASDGWSLGLLVRELAALYEAFSQARPSPLPDLPIQYADFAVWQRSWLQGKVLERQLGYWKEHLAGVPPLLQLPTNRPRPAEQRFCGDVVQVEIEADLTKGLRRLSKEQGTTLYMTLLAAFQLLMSRYTGQTDIVVGSPIANRNRQEIEPLIGFFVNTLALRLHLAGPDGHSLTVSELLAQVKEITEAAYDHQDLPFERLVEELDLTRNLNYNPLVQVLFALQNAPMDEFHLPGLTVTLAEFEEQTTRFDLELHVREVDNQLQGYCLYSTDLFDKGTIQRMMGHFLTLLAGIVADPQRSIAELPLLTEAERYQILVEWNDTQADYPFDQCIHQLFEEQVERTPEAVAVVFGDEELTYRELNARANQLAHYLIKQGIGPEVLVGICVERSLEMVVGLLAILKAGGAYVPLDPNYPAQRLAFILEDAQVKLILTQSELKGRLAILRQADVASQQTLFALDSNWQLVDANQENPKVILSPTNLAYVIYTSGSTGKPKGAMNTHQAIYNRLLWMQDKYQLTPTDSILQKTPFSFDVSVWEFFWPLIFGARLVVARPEGHKDPAYLVEIISRTQITTLHFVPSMLQLFLSAKGLSRCRFLKRVICSGEALPFDLMQRFLTKLNAELHNLYGPTEAAIDVTYWQCEPESQLGMVPIGRPVANTQIYLLDNHLQPVPIGVPGELHIGGVQVARGYLNRPQLTKQKFIPNPFGLGRLYKTGDLCRYLPDGNIEFLGRIDHQVKLRGFRIELGEIEAVLSQHPEVREVVVVLVDSGTQKRLVAYLVGAVSEGAMRAYLKEKVPDYMVPATFVQLEALPLTSNGKVDRRALPVPEMNRETFVPPRTPEETILVAIWQELLGVERVGIHDNFFELGGDSILSIQLVSRAHQAGVGLMVKQVFQYQTIAQLAAVAKTSTALQTEQGLVTGQVLLTPIQHWFFEQAWEEPHHFNQSVLLELSGEISAILLEKAFAHLIEHHDALRLRYHDDGQQWRQWIATPDGIGFKIKPFDFRSLNNPLAALEATAAELQASLNLAEGPIVQVALFYLPQETRLLIIIHHLAVDGVSWRILLSDLQSVYRQLTQGSPCQLPPKTTSYQQWALKLSEAPSSLASELTYWSSVVRGQSVLPRDHQLGANSVASAANLSVTLSVEETRTLLNQVPQVYHTQINDLLLTALLLAFNEWTQAESLLIDLEGHGREEIFDGVDLSRTVGWFTTIFPVRLLLPLDAKRSTPDFGETIKSVKEQLRQIPHRGLGYGVLRYLRPAPSLESPAEVSFNYLGQFDQAVGTGLIQGFAKEKSGPARSPKAKRAHLLDINAIVYERQLQVDWTYSRHLHRKATVQRVAESFLECLRKLIAHCQEPSAGGYTASDFPSSTISQKQLDKLIAKVKRFDGSAKRSRGSRTADQKRTL